MEALIQAILLALIQGMSEFLPVSSSAHLLLPSLLLGWEDQGLAFDVAVHLGTLLAVLLYFRRDIYVLLQGGLGALRGRPDERSELLFCLALATLPVALAGWLLADFVEAELRNLGLIATTTLLFGLLLGWADLRPGPARKLGLGIALVIGLAQMLALLPGVSRSGITMTAALFCGLSRVQGARFSFLLAIPVIAGAGLLQAGALLQSGEPVNWLLPALAAAVAAVVALLTIHFFLALLARIGFMPFVIYRLLLGGLLLAIWL